MVLKAREYGLDLAKNASETRAILDELTRLEHEGYVFEDAEASFRLLMAKATGRYRSLFDLIGYRVIVAQRGQDAEPVTEATLKVAVDGQEMLTVAEGDGPVHALDGALRKALEHFYPELRQIRLTDFKVRVVNVKEGTAARVRVLVESADDRESWSTIGVSTNVIEASWHALVDSVEYGLSRRMAPRGEDEQVGAAPAEGPQPRAAPEPAGART
jgi:2-isopropylmalate synthase